MRTYNIRKLQNEDDIRPIYPNFSCVSKPRGHNATNFDVKLTALYSYCSDLAVASAMTLLQGYASTMKFVFSAKYLFQLFKDDGF